MCRSIHGKPVPVTVSNLKITLYVREGEAYVLEDTAGKQNRFLLHQGNLLTEPTQVQVLDIVPVQEDAAADRIIEPMHIRSR